MGFVAAKCPSCGADLMVDDSFESAFCASCGVKFLVRAGIAFHRDGSQDPGQESQDPAQPNTNGLVIEAGVVKSYHGSSVDVTIPEGVFEIGSGVFRSQKYLKSVSIPNSVVVIGAEAFESCSSLESISLTDGLTAIHDRAFKSCDSLKSVSIPNSVVEIGDEAFESCGSLESVSLPDGLTAIHDGTFRSCDGLKSISIPDSVVEIGASAFESCGNLESISLPDSLTTIHAGSFKNCKSLVTVELNADLEEIESEAFIGCGSLKKLAVKGCSINNDDRYVFPEKYNTIEKRVFSHMPSEIVFLFEGDIHCKALSGRPETDPMHGVILGTKYDSEPFIEDLNCSLKAITIIQKKKTKPRILFDYSFYTNTKPERPYGYKDFVQCYQWDSKLISSHQELLENKRTGFFAHTINMVFHAEKSIGHPIPVFFKSWKEFTK